MAASAQLSAPTRAQVGGLPADVVDYSAVPMEATWTVADEAGNVTGKARWRTVANTGNCCENYVTASPNGRLLDMGGTFIRYTDDKGETWKEVRSISRTVNGEGAPSAAPGGDVVAVTWDPYSGDHTIAFKYDSDTEEWLHSELVLKTPFFDRPWFAVVPGPFTLGTIEAEYITILKGGWPSKDVMYISYDGLNYFQPSEQHTSELEGEIAARWLDFKPVGYLDWMQPNVSTGVVGLPGIGALGYDSDLPFNGDLLPFEDNEGSLMSAPEPRWRPFTFPNGKFPNGSYLADSRGRLHRLTWVAREERSPNQFDYSISANGGREWTTARFTLPKKHTVEDFDYKVNAGLGMAAVAVHAHRNAKDEADEVDQDLVFELDITSDKARFEKLYFVGDGDVNVGAALGANLRFDFATVAILPDRTIVTSFVDKLHTSPALAILLR